MTRAAALGVILAALAVAAPAGAAPFRATASISPRAVLFGDRVQARVDVVVDARVDDPAQTRVDLPPGAWTELGRTRVQTTHGGRLVQRSWQLVLACRTSDCAPTGASTVARLPPAQVTLTRRDGTVRRLSLRWPTLVVASRLPPSAATAASPPFRLQVAPPPPRGRVAASTASALLDAAAALLAAAAVAIALLELRRRRASRTRTVSPLQRALALAREAQTRPAADRRRALALLARVASPGDPALSADVAATAWERSEPPPERLAELVERAERLGRTP